MDMKALLDAQLSKAFQPVLAATKEVGNLAEASEKATTVEERRKFIESARAKRRDAEQLFNDVVAAMKAAAAGLPPQHAGRMTVVIEACAAGVTIALGLVDGQLEAAEKAYEGLAGKIGQS